MVKGGLITTRDAEELVSRLRRLDQNSAYFNTAGRERSYPAQTEARFIRVINKTGNDFETFQCGKIKMPEDDLDVLASLPDLSKGADYQTYELYDGDDEVGRTCVVQEGIGQNQPGMAIAHGLTFARIDYDLTDGHVDSVYCDTNLTNAFLIPLVNGTCEIIDALELKTDDTLGVVRIGPQRNCHAWGKSVGSTPILADMTVDLVSGSGATTGRLITGVKTNRLHTKEPSIAADSFVRIEWDLVSQKWHLVNAVCP